MSSHRYTKVNNQGEFEEEEDIPQIKRPSLHRGVHPAKLRPIRYYHRHEPLREESKSSFCYSINLHLYLLRSFLVLLFRPWLIFVLVLSEVSTYLCYRFGYTTEFPTGLLVEGIVLPISFMISYVYNRREQALIDIGSLKASAIQIYLCYREWVAEADFPPPDKKEGADPPQEIRNKKIQLAHEVREIMAALFHNINLFLSHKKQIDEVLPEIYRCFELINKTNEDLRRSEKWIQSVITRVYYYHRLMLNDFEKLRVVHDYRTASGLRAYGWVFLSLYPVLFGPFFADYAVTGGLWSGYYISGLSTLMFGCLYQILTDLEDPFYRVRLDTLNLDILEETPIHMTD